MKQPMTEIGVTVNETPVVVSAAGSGWLGALISLLVLFMTTDALGITDLLTFVKPL